MIGLRELQKCKNGVLGPITGLGWTNGDANLGLGISALNDAVENIDAVVKFISENDKGTGFGLETVLDVAIDTFIFDMPFVESSLFDDLDKLTGDCDADEEDVDVSDAIL